MWNILHTALQSWCVDVQGSLDPHMHYWATDWICKHISKSHKCCCSLHHSSAYSNMVLCNACWLIKIQVHWRYVTQTVTHLYIYWWDAEVIRSEIANNDKSHRDVMKRCWGPGWGGANNKTPVKNKSKSYKSKAQSEESKGGKNENDKQGGRVERNCSKVLIWNNSVWS